MIPEDSLALLRRIEIDFPEFRDDGCSGAPDRILWWSLRWACRLHDWRYCSRAHDPWELDQAHRILADVELSQNVRASLPWGLRWLAGLLYGRLTDLGGGYRAWNSCGSEDGARCRHGLALPGWMPPRLAAGDEALMRARSAQRRDEF